MDDRLESMDLEFADGRAEVLSSCHVADVVEPSGIMNCAKCVGECKVF